MNSHDEVSRSRRMTAVSPSHDSSSSSNVGMPSIRSQRLPATAAARGSQRRMSRTDAEIAGKISAVPGPDGVALQQPIQVRQVMDEALSNAAEMEGFLEHARGER